MSSNILVKLRRYVSNAIAKLVLGDNIVGATVYNHFGINCKPNKHQAFLLFLDATQQSYISIPVQKNDRDLKDGELTIGTEKGFIHFTESGDIIVHGGELKIMGSITHGGTDIGKDHKHKYQKYPQGTIPTDTTGVQ